MLLPQNTVLIDMFFWSGEGTPQGEPHQWEGPLRSIRGQRWAVYGNVSKAYCGYLTANDWQVWQELADEHQ